jgi:hypothetical protein
VALLDGFALPPEPPAPGKHSAQSAPKEKIMALSRNIDTDWGISVPDAYCRIEAVSLTGKDTMSFHVRSYTAAKDVPFFIEQTITCPYDITGSNPIAQAYQFLKTLPEFSDATDC